MLDDFSYLFPTFGWKRTFSYSYLMDSFAWLMNLKWSAIIPFCSAVSIHTTHCHVLAIFLNVFICPVRIYALVLRSYSIYVYHKLKKYTANEKNIRYVWRQHFLLICTSLTSGWPISTSIYQHCHTQVLHRSLSSHSQLSCVLSCFGSTVRLSTTKSKLEICQEIQTYWCCL